MFNKVILMGRLTSDPELKETPNGNSVCSFSLATSRVYFNKNTEKKVEDTTFHRIVAWNKQAEIISQYCKKGHLFFLEGRIENRSWEDKEGNKRTTTEVILEEMKLMPNKRDGEGEQGTVSKTISKKVNPKKETKQEEDFEDPSEIEDGEEIDIKDIPF